MEQIKHIRLDKIHPPSFDQRLSTSEQEDTDLTESIRELGILEPLLVKEVTDGYEIIAGNRRLASAGRAGLAAAPCIVIKTTGAEGDKIALHENIHRLPLSHIDQAYTFAHLIKKFNMTEAQVATLVHKSIAYISQHVCLLQCEETLINAVHDGRLNFTAARELMRCKDTDDRARLQNIVVENGATADVVHNWVEESNRETAILEGQNPEPIHISTVPKPQIPHYPCAACEIPTRVDDLKVVRLCPECHHGIFSTIEHEKFLQRTKPPPVAP